MKNYFLIALTLLVCGMAHGENQVKRTSSTRIKKEVPPPSNSFIPSVGLAYSGVTDLNDRNEGKMLTHSVGLDMGWSMPHSFSASLVSGGTYTSIDNQIVKDDSSHMTDTYAGLDFKYKFTERHGLEMSAGVFFPTSEDSQYEGQKGRFNGLARIRSKITKWYSISNKVSAQFINNEFEYSPTTDELNKRWLTDYGLDNVISAGPFFISAGFGVRNSTYIDGISELSYFNVSKIGFRTSHLSGVVAYMNGSYRDDQRLQPLFFDRYKKLVEFALIYAF